MLGFFKKDKKSEEAGNEMITRYIPVSVALMALVISIYVCSQVSEFSAKLDDDVNAVSGMQDDLENLQYAITSENSLYLMRTCDGFGEYLRMLRDSTGYTAFVAVRDIQGYCLNEAETDILKSMGFDQADILLENEYHSFIGIIEDGKMSYQQVGGDERLTYNTKVGDSEVKIESATINAGNIASISVDDVDRSVNERGFNFVVIDNGTGQIVDCVTFDTHVEEKTCIR